MKKSQKPNIWALIIILVFLSLILLWPVMRKGIWESADGGWMVIRLSAFHQSLRDGHFPVRWTQRLNHGYGYPVFNFLYPLPFYLGELIHLLGFGFVESVKLLFAGSVIAGGLGMYLFAKKWGKKAGLLASLLFIYAPYRIFAIYTRGSLGESVALSMVPFIFYFADRAAKQKIWKNTILMGVFYAGLIMSHNVVALLFTPLILAYAVMQSFRKKNKKNFIFLRSSLLALLIGLSVSAFFWIPALWELKFTRASYLEISNYQDYFLKAGELLSMLGPVHLALVLLGLIKRQWFFSAVSLISAFFIHPASFTLVSLFPLIEKIQFPWRIATVFMFTSAVGGAQAVGKFQVFKKHKTVVLSLMALTLMLVVLPHTANLKFSEKEESFYTTNDDTTTVQDEFTPIWVSQSPQKMPEKQLKLSAPEETYRIIHKELKTGKYYLQIRLQEETQVQFNTHYFPGWKVYVDDQQLSIDPRETDGLIKFRLTPGVNKLRTVEVAFEKTPIRRFSDILSFFSVLAVVGYFVVQRHKSRTVKGIAFLSLILAASSMAFFLISNFASYRQIFDPVQAEQAYLNSQWVNPDAGTNVPIGDSGLYSWAGWQYIHGTNPILINPEMPPLGKYLIGLGLLTLKKPAVVGFIFSALAIITHFFLGKEILKDIWLAAIASSLLLMEPVMLGLFNVTMLDGLQLFFMNLALIFFIKARKNAKWYIGTSLSIGAMGSTKFFASSLLLAASLFIFLVARKETRKAKAFLLSLPLAGLVHMASYGVFFAQGNGLRRYLGTQKWILEFYRKGNVGTVPPGSYWLLVLFNKWRIWFGQEWGKFTTVKSDVWQVTWPLHVMAFLISVFVFIKNKILSESGVLVIWLVFYSLFLTFIIGWPHYMLLFLPFSSIILVELARRFLPEVLDSLRVWKK